MWVPTSACLPTGQPLVAVVGGLPSRRGWAPPPPPPQPSAWTAFLPTFLAASRRGTAGTRTRALPVPRSRAGRRAGLHGVLRVSGATREAHPRATPQLDVPPPPHLRVLRGRLLVRHGVVRVVRAQGLRLPPQPGHQLAVVPRPRRRRRTARRRGRGRGGDGAVPHVPRARAPHAFHHAPQAADARRARAAGARLQAAALLVHLGQQRVPVRAAVPQQPPRPGRQARAARQAAVQGRVAVPAAGALLLAAQLPGPRRPRLVLHGAPRLRAHRGPHQPAGMGEAEHGPPVLAHVRQAPIGLGDVRVRRRCRGRRDGGPGPGRGGPGPGGHGRGQEADDRHLALGGVTGSDLCPARLGACQKGDRAVPSSGRTSASAPPPTQGLGTAAPTPPALSKKGIV